MVRAQAGLKRVVAQFDQHVFDAGLVKSLLQHAALRICKVPVEPHDMRDRITQRKTAFENFTQTAYQSVFEKPLMRDQFVVRREWKLGALVDELAIAALFDLDAIAVDRNIDVEPTNTA